MNVHRLRASRRYFCESGWDLRESLIYFAKAISVLFGWTPRPRGPADSSGLAEALLKHIKALR